MSTEEPALTHGPFVAEIDREDGWWMIHVLDPDLVTQAARWSEVETMARGVIVAMLDLDEDAAFDLELVPVFDDESAELLRSAEELEARALELVEVASNAKRSAVQALKSAGWTLQGIAAGLGLSYQRVEQIAKAAAPEEELDRPPIAANAEDIQKRLEQAQEAEMRYRSARSGKFVRSTTAARSPRTTVRVSTVAAKSTARQAHRSAITGRYVTKSTAARHPSTTVTEGSRKRS